MWGDSVSVEQMTGTLIVPREVSDPGGQRPGLTHRESKAELSNLGRGMREEGLTGG